MSYAALARRRLLQLVVVLFVISVVTFLIFFAIPGVDPARQLAGRNPTPAVIESIRKSFGLSNPLPVQYFLMMKHLLISHDLVSYTNRGVKVVPEILRAAPVTMSLVIGATFFWILGSLALGLVSARHAGRWPDHALSALSVAAICMPVFWVGELANLLFEDKLHHIAPFAWLPPVGYVPLWSNPVAWASHLLIPWLVLSLSYVGLYSRVIRGAVLEGSHEDYVRTARAKGLSERRVLTHHTLRTSLLSVVALFGLDFGLLVGGGALLVEVVFGLPGVGKLTFDAIGGLDLPVIMAVVLYGAFFIVVVNALVDLVSARLDPRVRA